MGWGPASAEQLILDPLPPGSRDLNRRDPVRFDLSTYYIDGGGRRAERYQLSTWLAVAERHALRLHVEYVGIEAGSGLKFGGGAPGLQWTFHLSDPLQPGLALDVGSVLPLGDGEIYPISTRAPSVTARLRWSPLTAPSWRLWIGYFGQRVSPPNDRTRPGEDFPSGSGAVAIVHGQVGSWSWRLLGQHIVAGLPSTTLVQGSLEAPIAADLSVRVSGGGVFGSTGSERAYDFAWRAGVAWHP